MSDENLYRDLLESEEREDFRNRQNLAPKAVGSFKPKPVDHNRAMHLYETEIKPVLERRKKALSSRAYRLFLKATGQWKGMDAKDVEMVDPTRGPQPTGPSEGEILAQIAADPTKFKIGSIAPPATQPVNAERRTIEPKWKEDEGQ
jgi:hypothetical protein